MNGHVEYPPEVLDFIARRIPQEMISVFAEIWNHRSEGGVTWTLLVSKIGDRYLVEKALLLLETNGFVNVDPSPLDRRQKKYIPDEIRGKQLALYLRDSKA
ncbi:hypothetical protein PUW24_00950 (plasmid) [Paenibacillus urinalis]|uniref:Uncharacterized protein n=2 Tax=Paenibacillus TaxID=44249 RepID=A0AAX3N855_9BACL|nr:MULTISPECIES: hypothetical protein [Paenibacillus]MCM3130517.1 hypothetical protein [Paenibacillus sp. MER 78]WDH85403.1 hypothetical protein PUW23_25540 [Paenibacillus urinalis]WDH95158.1 hypothetical protein PUW24_00950 [Paenibacillus urinalis]WDI05369.1 hypothetical protein PUW25_26620 [Paenibacillus urinalis]SDX62681.1 hypothetical protein SAMN05518848_11068 [Paenibacillus sp. PDC88]